MRLKSSKQRCHFYFHFWIPIVEAGVTHVDMKICALCFCPEVQKLSSLVLPSEVIIAQSSVPGKLTCKPLWVCWSLFKDQPHHRCRVLLTPSLYCFLWSQEKVWAFSPKPGSKRGQRWVRSPDAWCHLNTSTCTRTTTWCGRWGDVHVQTALSQLSCFGVFLFPWIFFLEQLCVFHNEK